MGNRRLVSYLDIVYASIMQSVVHGTAAWASPMGLLEMQNLWSMESKPAS